jgi:hypothetical protein
MRRKDTKMNTPKFPSNTMAMNLVSLQDRSAVLGAIIVLAQTYATAKKDPNKYAKYGYDFPAMIKVKVMELYEQKPNTAWLDVLIDSLMNALNSPETIIEICTQIKVMNRGIL